MKHRSTATELIAEGAVRLNRMRVRKAAHIVKQGDVLTLVLPGRVRVVRVILEAQHRGPAPEARQLYEDLMPQEPPAS